MVRIITDSGADIFKRESEKLKIGVVELTINSKGQSFVINTEEKLRDYYERLKVMEKLPTTSQPSPEDFLREFNKGGMDDETIYLGLSSKVSGTVGSALIAKDMSQNRDRIFVIDTLEGMMGLKILVYEAVRMRDDGYKAKDIVNRINSIIPRTVVMGTVDTLKYLRMGGRIPKGAGFIGDLLNIRPIIELKEGILVSKGKVRGKNAAMKELIKRTMAADIDPNFGIHIGHSASEDDAKKLAQGIHGVFNKIPYSISPVGGIIGTHIGPGSICIGYVLKE